MRPRCDSVTASRGNPCLPRGSRSFNSGARRSKPPLDCRAGIGDSQPLKSSQPWGVPGNFRLRSPLPSARRSSLPAGAATTPPRAPRPTRPAPKAPSQAAARSKQAGGGDGKQKGGGGGKGAAGSGGSTGGSGEQANGRVRRLGRRRRLHRRLGRRRVLRRGLRAGFEFSGEPTKHEHPAPVEGHARMSSASPAATTASRNTARNRAARNAPRRWSRSRPSTGRCSAATGPSLRHLPVVDNVKQIELLAPTEPPAEGQSCAEILSASTRARQQRPRHAGRRRRQLQDRRRHRLRHLLGDRRQRLCLRPQIRGRGMEADLTRADPAPDRLEPRPK